MAIRSVEYLQSLVRELAKLPDETEWVEFKCNNKQPQMIGEYISALSNSAALCERPKAYLVWGVDDATHKIVGTEFQYRKMKKGNEELEAWLSRMLSPRINFRFFEVPMDEGMVVLMEIPCAEKQPVQFAGGEYIRIGTNKKNLKEYPDKERELWRTFDSTPYELRIAMGNLNEDEMVSLLDYSKYYDKLEMPIPRNRDKVLEDLQHEKFIMKNDAGTWDITNMGALMIAKDLKKFESLHRRSVRVIWYKENSRLDAIREKEFCAGYAFSHEEIVQYIMTILYWGGIREGELLALTAADFDFEKETVRINKSYQRLHGEDVITTPKTKKSNRIIKMPKFLCEEMREYLQMLYGLKKKDRIFTVTKSYLHHEMDRGAKAAGVKRIRIHDLRHSHISLLIDMGFSAVAIADRVGHESIDITYQYAHLFPSKQTEMADRLDDLGKGEFENVS